MSALSLMAFVFAFAVAYVTLFSWIDAILQDVDRARVDLIRLDLKVSENSRQLDRLEYLAAKSLEMLQGNHGEHGE